jgi:Protein of unknown function (DUF742)
VTRQGGRSNRVPPPPPGAGGAARGAGSTPGAVSPQGGEQASAVRPFMVTEGRVAAEAGLPVETQVVATTEGLSALGALAFERRAIVEACGTPLSLAEVAVRLRLHLNVVRVLAGDLRASRLLAVHVPRAGTSSDIDVLRRVIDGLRAIPTSVGSRDAD